MLHSGVTPLSSKDLFQARIWVKFFAHSKAKAKVCARELGGKQTKTADTEKEWINEFIVKQRIADWRDKYVLNEQAVATYLLLNLPDSEEWSEDEEDNAPQAKKQKFGMLEENPELDGTFVVED